ncbi:MAG: TonB-dependent receptor plug domain-containing protein [Flammeovirgaceae bacterium]|nr:TonB-dependent receptor plug domain-containing protein [Flammeovirgaceae bacterium]
MNIIDKITTMDNMIDALSITILHSLWQGLLIAVILGFVLKALQRKSAETRYFASISAILVLLMVVIGTFLITFHSEENLNLVSDDVNVLLYEELVNSSTSNDLVQKSTIAQLSSFYYNSVETIKTYSDMIFICWLLGVGFFSLRFVSGLYYIQKIKTQKIQPVSDFWQQQLGKLCHKMGITLNVTMLKSSLVDVPTVVGWLKPVILMPVSMLSQIPVAEIEGILAHELAHIRRFDYLFNMLQSAIEILLFYNPAAWWISVCINDERENCCDDLALKATGSVKAYVNALANLAQTEYNTPELSLSVMGKKGSVLYRIKRIVAKGNNQLESANALSQRTLGRFTAALFTLFLLVFFTVSSGYKQSNAMTPEWKSDQVKAVFLGDTTKKKKLQLIEIAMDDTISNVGKDANFWVNEEIFTIEEGDTIMHNIVAIGEGGIWLGNYVEGSSDGVDEIIEIHSENDFLVNVHEVKVMHLKDGEIVREDFMQKDGKFNPSGDSLKWVIHEKLDHSSIENLIHISVKKDFDQGFSFEDSTKKLKIRSTNGGKNPLFVIDGRVLQTNDKVVKDLDPNSIKRIEVLKDEAAIARYGEKGKNGVIIITTKNIKEPKEKAKTKTGVKVENFVDSDSIHTGNYHDSKLKIRSTNGGKNPLFVIDGRVLQTNDKVVKDLEPHSIKEMYVLKDEAAIAKYGEKGKNGVVIITTKTLKERKEKAKAKTKLKIKGYADSDSVKRINLESDSQIRIKGLGDSEDVIIFIDGFESTQKSLEALDPNKIASMEVIKGEKAVEKFGAKGKESVIFVKTKKGKGPEIEKKNLVSKSALAQSVVAYPNPTDGEIKISFELKEKEKISIEIFDMSGKKVETLLNKSMTSGIHNVTWDAKDLSSGTYLLNIATKNEKIERKILLNK